jgi:alpha-methylacyl-CoA racemase
MGGGGMLLVNGILAALLEAHNSGQGQVIDAAMVDGVAQLMWMFHGLHALGAWDETQRESNLLDGAAHFYDTYECADSEYVSIGSIEPQFYALLIEKAGLDPDQFADQNNQALWPQLTRKLAEVMKTKTRGEWCEIMEGTDVCFAPVLNFMEAPGHPANVARQTYIEVDGITQPAPAPRFSRTSSEVRHGTPPLGADTNSTLAAMNFDEQEISALRQAGVIGLD